MKNAENSIASSPRFKAASSVIVLASSRASAIATAERVLSIAARTWSFLSVTHARREPIPGSSRSNTNRSLAAVVRSPPRASWMAAMTAYGDALGKIDIAATAGNATGIGAANTALTKAGTDSAVLSKQLGLHVCFAS